MNMRSALLAVLTPVLLAAAAAAANAIDVVDVRFPAPDSGGGAGGEGRARVSADLPEPAASARAARFYRADEGPPPPARPQRIVSLAPVATETLFVVGAGDRVVGVTRFCDRPPTAQALPKVGGYTDPSVERILALRPDLVVAMPSFGQRAILDRLRDAGVPVLVVFADTLDEVRALPRAVADAVGTAALGAEVAQRFDAALDVLSAQVHRRAAGQSPRVLIVVGVDPIVVAGPTTFADDVLMRLGATPVARRNGPAWPQWSPEAVLSSRPDVIVAADGPKSRARLQKLLAASRARIVSADREIMMRPGPSLLDDARVLAALIDSARAPPADAPAADGTPR